MARDHAVLAETRRGQVAEASEESERAGAVRREEDRSWMPGSVVGVFFFFSFFLF